MENSEPLPGSETTLISVSYTLLDVYKRQGSISLSVCHGPQAAALALRRGGDRSTVSYTHLARSIIEHHVGKAYADHRVEALGMLVLLRVPQLLSLIHI